MSKEVSAASTPVEIPDVIRVTAWILLILLAIIGVAFAIMSFTVSSGEVLVENPLTGSHYLAENLAIRMGAAALVLIVSSFGVLTYVYILKGRMWAYYLAFALLIWDMFGKTSFPPFRIQTVFHLNIISLILMIIFAVNYRGYRRFTDYQRRRATPQGEPDSV